MNTTNFYIKLKATLEETTRFPTKYLYKFIVPTQDGGIQKVEGFFDNMNAVITKKESNKGNYTGVSILVKLNSAEEVINKYKEVATVKGVISL